MVVIPEERQVRVEAVGDVTVRVVSYKLGKEYVCTVDNVDPGAVIARARGNDRESAEGQALRKVRRLLAHR